MEMFASNFHQCRKTGLKAHKLSAWPGVGVGAGEGRGRYGGAWGEGPEDRGCSRTAIRIVFLRFLNLSFTLDIFIGPFNPRM